MDFFYSHILRKQWCQFCRYFGGLMCDHLDENNNCLGFERYTIKDKIAGRCRQRKFNRILNRAFRKKYGKNWKEILRNKYGR